VWQLARAFIEITLRRRGPDSLPDSTFLVAFAIAVDAVVKLVAKALLDELSGMDFLLLATDIALLLAFVFSVLSFFKLERRYRQTVAAFFGADVVISVVFLPLALLLFGFGLDASSTEFLWLSIIEFLCMLVVGSWIFARSLSQPLIVGVMFTILYYLTLLGLIDFLIPDPETLGVATG
jgi:hypothetical protein